MPTITRCWTPIGQQQVILTPGVRPAKRWDWGAVNPVTGETLHVVHRRRNNVGFRRLLAAVARTYRLSEHPQRQVILFVDNDRAHDALPVRRLLAHHHHRIQIEWLPPYSPDLNSQEDIWQHLRRRVTHNHYFNETDDLLEAIEQFHRHLNRSLERVLHLIAKWAQHISV